MVGSRRFESMAVGAVMRPSATPRRLAENRTPHPFGMARARRPGRRATQPGLGTDTSNGVVMARARGAAAGGRALSEAESKIAFGPRFRGRAKVNADFNLLTAAVNLARFATLGVTSDTVLVAPSA